MIKQRFNNVRVNIAGPSDPQYLENLKTLVKNLGLRDNVSFIGVIEEEEKFSLIKSHRIVVLPSLKDYTPNLLLEAQALGVPVIATRVGAIPEMVLDRETGLLVKAGDPYELAKSIATLIENEDLRRHFSVKAREWAKKFTLESAVTRLEEVYRCTLQEE
jgi:glycosyltransferase involved in cell wall biosynthesis